MDFKTLPLPCPHNQRWFCGAHPASSQSKSNIDCGVGRECQDKYRQRYFVTDCL